MTRVEPIAKVRHLGKVEHLPIKQIVRRAKLSRNTVRKILRSGKTEFKFGREEWSQPVTGVVRETVKLWVEEDSVLPRKKRRTAQRIYDQLVAGSDYKGSYRSIAHVVNQVKEELKLEGKEAYIPLEYDKGDAFQFDWGESKVYIGGNLTVVQIGIVELCYSRYFYARAYPSQKQELMFDLHRRAFEHFGGVCKRGIYDNLKAAVKQMLKGNHRNLQERFVTFCSHYMYEPEFCNPAKGNEKGRVESMVGFVKRNFFTPIQRFRDMEELNANLASYVASVACNKEHPEVPGKMRRAMYEEEKEYFVNLPKHGYDCCRNTEAVVSPYSLVAFETNKYSVPTEFVGRVVCLKGYAEDIVVAYDGHEIARHDRDYGRCRQKFDPYHYLSVLARKPRAFRDGKPFKNWKLPEVFWRYREKLKDTYDDGDRYFAKTLLLLREWPVKEVTKALEKSLGFGVLGDSYVLSILRQNDEISEAQEHVMIKKELAQYQAKQRPLSDYDRILRERKDKNNGEQKGKDNKAHEGTETGSIQAGIRRGVDKGTEGQEGSR